MKTLLAFALLALSIEAQHREEVTVEVVEVPVYVHSSAGPIENLTRDRFELFVNGKPQPIDYFDVVNLGAQPSAAQPGAKAEAAPPPRDIRQRRLFLLIFDLTFSRAPAIERARIAAAKLVVAAPAGDAFAVATHTSNKGVVFVVPFTTDRAVINNAILKLRATTGDDPMRLRITDSERESMNAWIGQAAADAPNLEDLTAGLIEDPFTGGGAAMEDNRKEPMRRRIENQILDIGDLSTRLAGLEGQKHIVFFSEGFNPYLVHDNTAKHGPGAPQASSALIDTIQQMYRRLQSADTFVHAVDIVGLRHGFDPLVNDALNMISSGTGGEFIHNANDLGGALAKLEESHRYSYLLGFNPRSAKGGYNKIEVKVKSLPRGTTVSYRRGFSGTTAAHEIDGLVLADILANDIPQHGIETQLKRSEDGVILTVPSSAWAGLKPDDRPVVLVYVFNAKNIAVQSKQIRLNAGAEQFDLLLQLAPGDVVKVLVRAGESLGFSRLAID